MGKENRENRGERGSALMQVMVVCSLLAITSYLFVQFMTKADRESINLIHRNDNINSSLDLSTYVNDCNVLGGAVNIVNQDSLGAAVKYP